MDCTLWHVMHAWLKMVMRSVHIETKGEHHRIDLNPFVALGCSVNEEGNLEIFHSPIGSDEFCQNYCLHRVGKAQERLKAVGKARTAIKMALLASRLEQFKNSI